MNAALPDHLVLNQQDAAKALSRSSRWLSSQDDAPRRSKEDGHGYELPALVEWFVDRESNSELRDEKTRKEIAVLTERQRKLEIENGKAEAFLVDVRDLNETLTDLAAIMRETGDTLARKRMIAGRDAVELWNSGIEKYERKRQAMIAARSE